MKKNKQLAIFMFIAFISSAIFFTGCENQIAQTGENTKETSNGENENSIKKTGTITGKALFSNSEDNSGIIITLEKTEENISESVASIICKLNIENEEDMSRNISYRSIIGSTTTDSDGNYKFENVKTGVYTVYASSDHSSEKAVSTNISVLADTTATVADLKLTATGTISGIITLDDAESGNEAFLVFVAGTSYMAMTDTSGKYTISGVPAGTNYQLIVTKGNLTKTISSNVTVTANGSTIIPNINFTKKDINEEENSDNTEINCYYSDTKLSISYKTNENEYNTTLSDSPDSPNDLSVGIYEITSIISKFCMEDIHSYLFLSHDVELPLSQIIEKYNDFKITSSSELVSFSEDYTQFYIHETEDQSLFNTVIELEFVFDGNKVKNYFKYLPGIIDYTDYMLGNYSIKVRNNSTSNVVCFLGEPSEETLISGAIGGGKTTGLKKDSKLFKDSSFDFVLYVYTEEAYLNGRNDYKTLAQNPLCRLYAFYNADTKANANLVYTISDKLGGEYYFQLNNNTKYNCEIRKDGLYDEPFCYAGAYTLKTVIYAQEGDYAFYPVFRKFDRNTGAILTNYPKTNKGNPISVTICLGKAEEPYKIDCATFLTSDFKIAPSATYLTIDNTSGSGVKLYKSAVSTAYVTDTGIDTINSGKKATFSITLNEISEGFYEESTINSGWKVGTEVNKISVPTASLLAGELYTLVVEGPSYADLSCYYLDEDKDGAPDHTTLNFD